MRDDAFDAQVVQALTGLDLTAGWGRAVEVPSVTVGLAPVTEPCGGPLNLRIVPTGPPALAEGWRVLLRVGPPGPSEDVRESVTDERGCCSFGHVRPGDRVKVILAERL